MFLRKLSQFRVPEVQETQCNYDCVGNSSQSCGGFWHIDIHLLNPVNPGVQRYVAEGCYADKVGRILGGTLHTSERFMTPNLCAGLCTGSRHFGLEDSTQCFCGDVITSTNIPPGSGCNYTCSGDPTKLCGGFWFLNLYSFS